MRRYCLLLSILFIAYTSGGQIKPGVIETYQASNGKYILSHYTSNIIKLQFIPNGYVKNENVSDAVTLRPKTVSSPSRIKVNGDIISFNGKAILVKADTMNGGYGFSFALETGERIFGGGERALPLNRRGYRFNLYNNPWYGYSEGADNLNYSVPFFTSSKGYGLFFDNPSKGFADIGKEDENILKVGFSSGELNVYVISGNDYKEILQSYHQLTGTQPLPPRWAFGNLMSRFGYTSEKQVKDILAKMHAENVPVDAIIFDLFWFGDSIKGTMGNLEWINKKKWPDPRKMIADFRKKSIHTILVTEPFFVETSKNYQASKKFLAVDSAGKPYYLTDFYFGKGGLIDIFRKDSKDWFWRFYKKQMDMGVEAWWGDLGEPEKHPASLYHNLKDKGYKRLFAADEVHNIYGHNWTKMLYEKYAKEYPNKRLFSLNRSGFAGSQRYGIFPWTGDVSRSWSGLRAQLPILLGMSMSGVPYVHSDAGGFAGGEGDNELYVRWLQFAAFTPIFRPHGTALYEVEPQAFSFPSEVALIDSPWRDYAKSAIYARYGLMPYNYSLAYGQTVHGKPLMAPLYYHFPNDTVAATIQNQYMWGDYIMVAPVLEKGITNMKVYLPKGTWLGLDGGFYWENDWINVKVQQDFLPVFIKEGALLPQLFTEQEPKEIWNTSGYYKYGLRILYFTSNDKTTFTLYQDDGVAANALSTGKFTLTHLSGQELEREIRISVNPSNKLYAQKNYEVLVKGIISKPDSVRVNKKRIPLLDIDDKEQAHKTKQVAYWDEDGKSVLIMVRSATPVKTEIVISK